MIFFKIWKNNNVENRVKMTVTRLCPKALKNIEYLSQ